MKNWVKIFVILGLLPLFFACATNDKQEEKFVNPIFYKKMYSLSISSPWDMQLAPNYITYSYKDSSVTEKCILTKNAELLVEFICLEPYQKKSLLGVICKLQEEDEYHSSTWLQCRVSYMDNNISNNIENNWSEINNYAIH